MTSTSGTIAQATPRTHTRFDIPGRENATACEKADANAAPAYFFFSRRILMEPSGMISYVKWGVLTISGR